MHRIWLEHPDVLSRSEDGSASQNDTLHIVDQVVSEIAKESRFTVEEVKEYYDRCGDAERTRRRFRKMREVLSQLPDDEALPNAPPVVEQPNAPAEVEATPQIQQIEQTQQQPAPVMAIPAVPSPMPTG